MTTLLISDLHLDDSKPHLIAILQRFLAGPARQADAVYLLGDVFEAWVGDDDQSPFVRSIESALRDLSASGVSTYFMHGNRDFMVASNFAKRTGVVLLPDPTVVTLGGVRTLLAHGDRYCTDDLVYQAFRAKSRTDAWQSRMLRYPLFIRRWIARRGRRKSMALQAKGKATGVIANVVDAALIPEMDALGVTRLIHGHTHRPAEHELNLATGKGERIVLADWREEGEALEVRDDGSFVRIRLRG